MNKKIFILYLLVIICVILLCSKYYNQENFDALADNVNENAKTVTTKKIKNQTETNNVTNDPIQSSTESIIESEDNDNTTLISDEINDIMQSLTDIRVESENYNIYNNTTSLVTIIIIIMCLFCCSSSCMLSVFLPSYSAQPIQYAQPAMIPTPVQYYHQ